MVPDRCEGGIHILRRGGVLQRNRHGREPRFPQDGKIGAVALLLRRVGAEEGDVAAPSGNQAACQRENGLMVVGQNLAGADLHPLVTAAEHQCDSRLPERPQRFGLIGAADDARNVHLLQNFDRPPELLLRLGRCERENVAVRLKLLLNLLKQFRIVEVGQPGKDRADDMGAVPPQHLPGEVQPIARVFRQLSHGLPHFGRDSRRSLQRHRYRRLGDVQGSGQLPLRHFHSVLRICLSVLIIR